MGVIQTTDKDYTRQLDQLLPEGPAWPREGDAPTARAFPPVGTAMAAAHARLNQLIEEADARTTSELLDDFERVVGLPDPCLDPPASTAERRRRVVQRLTYQGGQSAAFFVGLLATLGYAGASITEYRPFRARSACNEALNQGGWRYGWTVKVPVGLNVDPLDVTGRCNDPLASWGNTGLECFLAGHKPAHSRLFVGYGV